MFLHTSETEETQIQHLSFLSCVFIKMCGTSLCTYRLMQPESSVKRLLRCLCTDQSITDLNQSLTVFHSEDVIVNLLVCVWTQILTNRTDRDSPVTQSDTSSCRFSLLLPSTPELTWSCWIHFTVFYRKPASSESPVVLQLRETELRTAVCS